MDNLFYRVLPYCDIDTKLKFGITPKKLPLSVISNLDSKFPRPQVVYLTQQQKILNFVLAYSGKHFVIENVEYQGTYNGFHWFHSKELFYGVYDKSFFYISPNEGENWLSATDLKSKFVETIDEDEDTQSSS